MFEDIRKSYGLTRQELADLTHRSVNYILKAEQATFPSAPVALVDYYVQNHGYEKAVMVSAYRDEQRRRRRSWLEEFAPKGYTAGLPFRKKWVKRMSQYGSAVSDEGLFAEAGAVGLFPSAHGKIDVFTTQYGISVGLCLPAAVIYRNEKDLTKAGAIATCMEDLCEYVLSGEYNAMNLGSDEQLAEETSILRIAKEEGVVTHDYGTAA
jgi:hypothetical protein